MKILVGIFNWNDFILGDHDVVKNLIASGTDVHSVTSDGRNPLHKAAEKGDFIF